MDDDSPMTNIADVAATQRSAQKTTAVSQKEGPSDDELSLNLDSTNLYLNDIGHIDLLTREQEYDVATLAKAGNEHAKKRMVESNLRLVVKIARNYRKRGVAFLDLIEEGNFGLMHAVSKFDPEKGFRFSTYATWWIRQSIERGIMNQTRTIRLPVHVIKELNTYLRAAKGLKATLGRKPTLEEIAEQAGKPVDKVKEMLKLKHGTSSLDIPRHPGSMQAVSDNVAAAGVHEPSQLLEEMDQSHVLDNWLALLAPDEEKVLIHRYGLKGRERLTLAQTGRLLEISAETVRQIQDRTLRKLKNHLKTQDIELSDLLD